MCLFEISKLTHYSGGYSIVKVPHRNKKRKLYLALIQLPGKTLQCDRQPSCITRNIGCNGIAFFQQYAACSKDFHLHTGYAKVIIVAMPWRYFFITYILGKRAA